jgi:transposase-like protein
MRRERHFTEEQVVAVWKQAQGGANVQGICRRHEIWEATFYK